MQGDEAGRPNRKAASSTTTTTPRRRAAASQPAGARPQGAAPHRNGRGKRRRQATSGKVRQQQAKPLPSKTGASPARTSTSRRADRLSPREDFGKKRGGKRASVPHEGPRPRRRKGRQIPLSPKQKRQEDESARKGWQPAAAKPRQRRRPPAEGSKSANQVGKPGGKRKGRR